MVSQMRERDVGAVKLEVRMHNYRGWKRSGSSAQIRDAFLRVLVYAFIAQTRVLLGPLDTPVRNKAGVQPRE